ncbi:MAG: hypothetical protein MJA84_14020 [Firmicutes bacterium]|nr:hypothetical protein [Bacillota bacterium]
MEEIGIEIIDFLIFVVMFACIILTTYRSGKILQDIQKIKKALNIVDDEDKHAFYANETVKDSNKQSKEEENSKI